MKRAISVAMSLLFVVSIICANVVPVYAAGNYSYEYKYEYGKKTKKSVSCIVTGQPEGGTRFKTGGAFYYADGSDSVKTLTISFPKPFNSMAVNVPFGKSANQGEIVNVPDSTHYWKLKVIKTYKYQPYIIYYRLRNSNQPWKIYTKSHISFFYSLDCTCVRA